jgi:hypothetical protein
MILILNFRYILLFFIFFYIDILAKDFSISKSTIKISSGVYLLKDIELKNNMSIKGENKFTTIIKLDKNARKALFYAKDKSNIEISNLTILNETTQRVPLLDFEGNKSQIKNITIKNCIVKAPKAESDIIVFRKYISNIRIENNIIEAKKNPTVKRDYKQISCIRLQGVSTHSKNNSYVYIRNNILRYGNSGFRISGKGTPPNPLWFENNVVEGQVGCGAFFYHGAKQKIINNYFTNIKAVSMKNNDGGVVWLDQYHNNDILFSGNTIENNYGNGLYLEELQNAVIANNFIYKNKKRINDKYIVKNKNKTYISNGGNGVLLTGGIRRLQFINNQISNNENNGIYLNKNLGVALKYNILLSIISFNSIVNNGLYGIQIKDDSKNIIMNNNIIISNKNKFINRKNAKNINANSNFKLLNKKDNR